MFPLNQTIALLSRISYFVAQDIHVPYLSANETKEFKTRRNGLIKNLIHYPIIFYRLPYELTVRNLLHFSDLNIQQDTVVTSEATYNVRCCNVITAIVYS